MKLFLNVFIAVLTINLCYADVNNQINDIHQRLGNLSEDAMNFWIENGPDIINNGFVGEIDNAGNPNYSANKGLIQQSRYLWTFSMWYEKEEQTQEIKDICDNLYSFLINSFRDESTGGFFFSVNSLGNQVVSSQKMSYAEGFAVYALAQYAISFQNSEAAEYAMDAFRAINERAYDQEYGGYNQNRDDQKWIEAAKGTNTHLHLLEAFTTLYMATEDEAVGLKLRELLDIFLEHIIQPEGHASYSFNRDWSVAGDQLLLSYGHDIESAWLLYKAAEVLGLENDSDIIDKLKTLAQVSADEGFDYENGGFFYEGRQQVVTDLSKIWWVQAEAILGLWRLYEWTEDELILDKIQQTISWTENRQLNTHLKESYWEVDEIGNSIGSNSRNIASEWKTSYHTVRAYVYAQHWIRSYLEQQEVSISKSPLNFSVSLGPNPIQNELQITISDAYEYIGTNVRLKVYDSRGRLFEHQVASISSSHDVYFVTLTELPTGVCYLVLEVDGCDEKRMIFTKIK